MDGKILTIETGIPGEDPEVCEFSISWICRADEVPQNVKVITE